MAVAVKQNAAGIGLCRFLHIFKRPFEIVKPRKKRFFTRC